MLCSIMRAVSWLPSTRDMRWEIAFSTKSTASLVNPLVVINKPLFAPLPTSAPENLWISGRPMVRSGAHFFAWI